MKTLSWTFRTTRPPPGKCQHVQFLHKGKRVWTAEALATSSAQKIVDVLNADAAVGQLVKKLTEVQANTLHNLIDVATNSATRCTTETPCLACRSAIHP